MPGWVQVIVVGASSGCAIDPEKDAQLDADDIKYFIRSFYEPRRGSLREPYRPNMISFETEENYTMEPQGRVYKPIREFFVQVDNCDWFLAAVGNQSRYNLGNYRAYFQAPARSAEERKVSRAAGPLLERFYQIQAEYDNLHAARDRWVRPSVKSGFVDQKQMAEALERIKTLRADPANEKHALSHSDLCFFASQPVDMAATNLRLDALFEEECDIVLALCELRLQGMQFEFVLPF